MVYVSQPVSPWEAAHSTLCPQMCMRLDPHTFGDGKPSDNELTRVLQVRARTPADNLQL